jgi:wyosine [tRNA(Phe)-imidazoG37] synthetase (radical SAM superfamily)
MDAWANHSRRFDQNRFVYPVWSRRAEGLSVGINLNPDKVCNFDCIYCQVDRTVSSDVPFVEWDRLLGELDSMLELVVSGEIWTHPRFATIDPRSRRVNDLAFSGDGEPTTYRNFDEIVSACAERKRQRGLNAVKMVLITNASMFHRASVQRGLALLDQNQGEIWAKLDAGTDEYFQRIDRTPISFQKILSNIVAAARIRPLVIQSLFMRVESEPPPPEELEAFCDRLNEIKFAGGRIQRVQVYTIARRPAESWVTPLARSEVDAIVDRVRRRTGLEALPYYGYDDTSGLESSLGADGEKG